MKTGMETTEGKSLQRRRVLLVEDETDFGNVLTQFLEFSGFAVTLARDGKAGWDCFCTHEFDICVLDVMMPELDGFSLAEKIKATGKDIPFIFLTARSQKADRIQGLKMGADDYICKPFEVEELVLRIQNILKRTGGPGIMETKQKQEDKIGIGGYNLNLGNLELNLGEWKKQLTQKEAELLHMLAMHKGQLVKRSEILVRIWGEDDYFLGRSMDVFISRLRKVLDKDSSISIDSVRGQGFILRIKGKNLSLKK